MIQNSKLYLSTKEEKYKDEYYNTADDLKMWITNPFDSNFILENKKIETSLEYDKDILEKSEGWRFLECTDKEQELWDTFKEQINLVIEDRNNAIKVKEFSELSSERLIEHSEKSNVAIRVLNYDYIERINTREAVNFKYQKFIVLMGFIIGIILIYKVSIVIKEFILYYNKDINNKKIFDNIIENMTLGLVIQNNEEGYVFINKQFRKMINSDVEGSNIKDIIIKNKDVFEKLDKIKNGTEDLKIRINECEFEWQISKFYIFDTNLKYKNIYIVNDLTNERIYENEQAELMKKINDIKVASEVKQNLVSNISHEVRTPLNAILGMADALKGTDINEKQGRYINNIKDAAKMLLGIINSILEFSKLNKKEIILNNNNFKVSEFINTIENMFKDQIELKGVSWKCINDIEEDMVIVGDSIRLSQIIINLIGNAFKFTKEGSIEFKLEKLFESEDDVTIRFIVRDTGKGIEGSNLSKVFLPFEQLDDKGEAYGTGLGLAISQNIAKAMKSEILVESIYGIGSKFDFKVTFKKGKFEEKELIENKIGLKKILLVDDNELNREVGMINLDKLSVEYYIAKDGKEAIKICEKKGENYFDIILMDLQMPGLDGYETAKVLKEELAKETSIIALTATELDDEKFEFYKEYMDSYVMKPLNLEELEAKIIAMSKYSFEKKLIKVIDYEKTMDRFDDNKNLYMKLYKKMKMRYENSPEEIKKYINDGNKNEAIIFMHTLKGVAANLGFEKLREVCIKLEEEIKHNNVSEEVLNEFEYHNKVVMSLL